MAAVWLSGWSHRIKIIVDKDQFGSNATHFPIRLYISGSSGQSNQDLTPVFDELGVESLKLAVTKGDGLTEIYVEVEEWDNGAEEANLWIAKSDLTISSTADTVLYLYYDQHHADNTTYVGATNTTPAEAVWDNDFELVYHMKDGVSNASVYDSTNHNLDGAKLGANEPIEVSGEIDGSQSFDGVDDKITPSAPPAITYAGGMTVEVFASIDLSQHGCFTSAWITTRNIFQYVSSGAAYIGDIASKYAKTGNGYVESGYHYYAGVCLDITTAAVIFYKDAVVEAHSGDVAGNMSDNWTNYQIGVRIDGGLKTKGIVDEFRVSSTDRSSDWVGSTNETLNDNMLTFVIESLEDPAYWGFATWA